MPLGIKYRYAVCHYVEWRDYLNVMLSVVMLNIIMPIVVAPYHLLLHAWSHAVFSKWTSLFCYSHKLR